MNRLLLVLALLGLPVGLFAQPAGGAREAFLQNGDRIDLIGNQSFEDPFIGAREQFLAHRIGPIFDFDREGAVFLFFEVEEAAFINEVVLRHHKTREAHPCFAFGNRLDADQGADRDDGGDGRDMGADLGDLDFPDLGMKPSARGTILINRMGVVHRAFRRDLVLFLGGEFVSIDGGKLRALLLGMLAGGIFVVFVLLQRFSHIPNFKK